MITIDFNRLSIKPGDRILDIGCGTGRHTCAAFRFKEVVAVGVDINFDDVLETKCRLEHQKNLRDYDKGLWGIAVADIFELPFKDNYFDLVICSEVLEHIQDHRAAISETVRVLKPDKSIVVSVPRYLPERICWAISDKYHNEDNGHVRVYRKQELIDLIEDAGVKKWKVHFAHSLHTPYWWLKCLVGPSRKDCYLVNKYHKLLIWDIMKRPRLTGFFDHLLNPIIGKSLVVYFKKDRATRGASACAA